VKKNSETLKWNVMLIWHGHYMHAHAMLSTVHTPALTRLWCHTETKLYSNHGHWCVAYKWQVLYKADISETRNFNEVHGSYTIIRKMLLYDNSFMCTYHHLLFITMAPHNVWNQTKDNSSRFSKWKMIPILNESGLLKIPVFKTNLVQ
jgi:hypothetical protein